MLQRRLLIIDTNTHNVHLPFSLQEAGPIFESDPGVPTRAVGVTFCPKVEVAEYTTVLLLLCTGMQGILLV